MSVKEFGIRTMKNIFFLFVLSGGFTFCYAESERELSSDSLPVVLVVGTRPEAIKLIPLYWALKKEGIPTLLLSTGQHSKLLDDVFTVFDVRPDFECKVMKPGQDLFYLTEVLLTKMKGIFEQIKPALVVVQGDTTSAMVGALSAFYLKIPVAHVEAGLRTGNIYAPFPEEVNRKLITTLASLHFAPTLVDANNLYREGVSKDVVYCVGNTVVDMLFIAKGKLKNGSIAPSSFIQDVVERKLAEDKKIVLLTVHRRELLTSGMQEIFSAIKKACIQFPELFIIYPAHPNPLIHQHIEEAHLASLPNLLITDPLSYYDMVYLLDKAHAVATDSGGVQEEATSLNKPVLVLRTVTDRIEAVNGKVELVGTDEKAVFRALERVVKEPISTFEEANLGYGDGHTSQRITQIIQEFLCPNNFKN